MKMHRVDVSPRFGVPADGHSLPDPGDGQTRAAHAGVCEWAVDLDREPAVEVDRQTVTVVAATGYVDFDAVESVHVADMTRGQ